jgi:hypothetical protein
MNLIKQEKYRMKDDEGRFKKGHSGNPGGRPLGTRNKATQIALQLLEGEAEKLSRKAVDLALDGDATALRLCLERLCAPIKERPVILKDIPSPRSLQDLPEITTALLGEITSGSILPSQAIGILKVLNAYQQQIEVAELEKRIEDLEGRLNA